MIFPNARLIMLLKTPVLGTVKTRLIPAIGRRKATHLHKELVRWTLDSLSKNRVCPIQLSVAGDLNHPFIEQLTQEYEVSAHLQIDGNLGERMAHEIKQAATGNPILLIGSDCPLIGPDLIESACCRLQQEVECVLVPAEDGGYVMIGMKNYISAIFTNIDWGTNRVLSQTLLKLQRLRISTCVYPAYWDVDRPEDAKRFYALATPDVWV